MCNTCGKGDFGVLLFAAVYMDKNLKRNSLQERETQGKSLKKILVIIRCNEACLLNTFQESMETIVLSNSLIFKTGATLFGLD